jgi:hypothetical protein
MDPHRGPRRPPQRAYHAHLRRFHTHAGGAREGGRFVRFFFPFPLPSLPLLPRLLIFSFPLPLSYPSSLHLLPSPLIPPYPERKREKARADTDTAIVARHNNLVASRRARRQGAVLSTEHGDGTRGTAEPRGSVYPLPNRYRLMNVSVGESEQVRVWQFGVWCTLARWKG